MSFTKYDIRELQMTPAKHHALIVGGAIGVLAVAGLFDCAYKISRAKIHTSIQTYFGAVFLQLARV